MTPNPLSQASNENFAGQVVNQLKQDILQGYFAPGEKLRMVTLKARYNMGVGPLREALSQLLVEQLVVVENQRGFRVHPVSQAELKDIYHTRAHIESLCTKLAIEHGDDHWEANIIACDHRLKKAASLLTQDPILDTDQARLQRQEWEHIHHQFHSAITLGCQSPTLLDVRHSLYEKASRYRNLWLQKYMMNNHAFDANEKDHQQLLQAILKRDSTHACEIIYEHLLGPYKLLNGSEL